MRADENENSSYHDTIVINDADESGCGCCICIILGVALIVVLAMLKGCV